MGWSERIRGDAGFADAGCAEVSRPSPRRVVLRIDFTG
jgi:hypothetical protein